MFAMFRKLDWFFTDFIKRYKFVFVIKFKENSPRIDKLVLIVTKTNQ